MVQVFWSTQVFECVIYLYIGILWFSYQNKSYFKTILCAKTYIDEGGKNYVHRLNIPVIKKKSTNNISFWHLCRACNSNPNLRSCGWHLTPYFKQYLCWYPHFYYYVYATTFKWSPCVWAYLFFSLNIILKCYIMKETYTVAIF